MGKLALPPGFRFHPTDEELISYYLKRKVSGRRIEFEAIGDLDLYKFEPWDLPELSRLQTKDLEWYFFCPRDRKYPNGSRTNRATENGYWKATGKDRAVSSRNSTAGMKKTLVYYKGRAPKGERTNWVMHEYRLGDGDCDQSENGYVLCRIYQKSGAGPKNGEQYGAPVEEEEWEANPAIESDDFSGLGATLSYGVQETLHSADGTSESHDVKPFVSNGKVSEQMGTIKTEPVDVKVLEEEDTKFTNLRVEMLAEPQERGLSNEHVSENLKVSFDDPHGTEMIASFLLLPEGEEEILEEIQGLVSAPYNKIDQGVNVPTEADKAFETNAFPPRDGDFFELDDLSPMLDFNDTMERGCSPKDIWGFNGESTFWPQSSSKVKLQDGRFAGHLKRDLCMIDKCHVNGRDSGFPKGSSKSLHSSPMLQNTPEMQTSFTTCTDGSHCQMSSISELEKPLLQSDLYGAAFENCSCMGEELEYSDVLEFFEQYNMFDADEKKSFNAEFLGGRSSTSLIETEGLHVGHDEYLDSFTNFSDLADLNLQSLGSNSCEAVKECASYVKSDALNKEHIAQMPSESGALTKSPVEVLGSSSTDSHSFQDASKFEGKFDNPEVQIQASKEASEERGPSKAFGVILSCLKSIPVPSAIALDDMPFKSATSVGSISVLASSVDIRAVAIGCSCNKKTAASSCVTCSFVEGGTYVRSLSYSGGDRMVVDEPKPSTSLSAVAVMGALWGFFWFLMAGGAWKLAGGIYRLVFS